MFRTTPTLSIEVAGLHGKLLLGSLVGVEKKGFIVLGSLVVVGLHGNMKLGGLVVAG